MWLSLVAYITKLHNTQHFYEEVVSSSAISRHFRLVVHQTSALG